VRFANRLSPPDDAALVARCREGDQAAWAELVERYARYVYAIAARGYRLSDADAEDVFQEVFARAYQHLGRLRADQALRPWIAQMTRNLCVDRLRELQRVAPEALAADAAGEELFARLDQALAVHQAMATLPATCRDVLDRFFARDQSYATIGAALDIPPGTIASRISRCLARLRTVLAPQPELGVQA
jgi:RNA polymerase sigma factor (sigma-70 family)